MSPSSAFDPVPQLARELSLAAPQVKAVVGLLAEGNTIPFIARYRKEATGELDEVQIRAISERHEYLAALEERRQTILSSIAEQDKLTAELEAAIRAAETKSALEDLYLPYKPKRRTRATIARERGLEPLAERLLAQPTTGDPEGEAVAFVDAAGEVPDVAAALAGARDIAAEVVAERADVRALVRRAFFETGFLVAEVVADQRETKTKFEQYYDYREAVASIPSHRFLAIRRGEREEVLRARIEVEVEALLAQVLTLVGRDPASPFAAQLGLAVEDGYARLLAPSVENDVRVELKLRSDRDAVDVFASNLRNLLMAAPLGERPVIGFDPGLRTGCKVAAVDATGKFLATTVLYLSRSDAERDRARGQVLGLLAQHGPTALAVGNGTGGRETEQFLRQVLRESGDEARAVVQVNEAGASVYSASDLAREEFPDQDVTVRGAISIARRLQDPLAELVKIEPKAIGVGQYQHDVHQPLLVRKLDEVVESCVNQVGVELNTASAPLMARVAGIGPAMAKKIVAHRNEAGAFDSRQALLAISGFGPKRFEQAAGFIRVREGGHPLDASAVHPERYALVERMAADLGVDLAALIGQPALVDRIDPAAYVSDAVGEPTLRDILAELKKPGRDPRASFDPVQFRDDVHSIADLQVGMLLEGVVTNVTAFGAFVDVGVHRDGLVHISQLADRFVSDPQQVVKVGDRLRVRVLEADVERDRISLSARSEPAAGQAAPPPKRSAGEGGGRPGGGRPPRPQAKGERRPPKRDKRREAGRGSKRAAGPAAALPADSGSLTHNPFADLLKKG